MLRSELTNALALIAAIGLLAPWCRADPKPAGDHQLAIGVVRTERIFQEMPERKKFQDELRARLMELQQQQQQREQELQDLQKHRDVNDRHGSQQWTDDTNAIDDKAAELDAWVNRSKTKLERWKSERIKEMFDHLADATAQVAQQQHLDLVIADQSPYIGPDLDQVPAEKLQALLAARAVLFANKKADITEDVLTVMEAIYAKNASSSSAPTLPKPPPAPH